MIAILMGWFWALWPTIRTVLPSYLNELSFDSTRKQLIISAMVFGYDIARRNVKETIRAWMPSPSFIAGLLDWLWPWLVVVAAIVAKGAEDLFSAIVSWSITTFNELMVAVSPVAASAIERVRSAVRDARVVFRWAFGEDPWPLGHGRAVIRGARPWLAVVVVVASAISLVATPVSAGCVRSGETMVCGGGLCDPTPMKDLERLLLNGDAHAPTPEAVLDAYPNLQVRDK